MLYVCMQIIILSGLHSRWGHSQRLGVQSATSILASWLSFFFFFVVVFFFRSKCLCTYVQGDFVSPTPSRISFLFQLASRRWLILDLGTYFALVSFPH